MKTFTHILESLGAVVKQEKGSFQWTIDNQGIGSSWLLDLAVAKEVHAEAVLKEALMLLARQERAWEEMAKEKEQENSLGMDFVHESWF